ncbi:MAG TPA: hypothetical protein VHP82_00880 [Gaiellaceae bacterium]|nr:hypothetical protein [Gaiellaceae bacterium]
MPKVVASGAHRPGDDDRGRHLRRQPEAAPRPGKRSQRASQGGSLRPLAARERRAVRALAQVRTQLRALGPREVAVQLLREGELCVAAGERALELFPKRAPSTKDERLDRAHRDAEHVGDLGVRASLDLAQDDGRALVERKVSERAPNVLRSRPDVLVDERVGNVVVERHLLRPPRVGAEPLQADVVRNRDQPVERSARILTALERPEGVHERRLGDVLGVRPVAQDAVRIPVDVRPVPAVHPLEGAVHARPRRL